LSNQNISEWQKNKKLPSQKWLISGKVCSHYVHNRLSSRLLSQNVILKQERDLKIFTYCFVWVSFLSWGNIKHTDNCWGQYLNLKQKSTPYVVWSNSFRTECETLLLLARTSAANAEAHGSFPASNMALTRNIIESFLVKYKRMLSHLRFWRT
jgi:hypothetical protein